MSNKIENLTSAFKVWVQTNTDDYNCAKDIYLYEIINTHGWIKL